LLFVFIFVLVFVFVFEFVVVFVFVFVVLVLRPISKHRVILKLAESTLMTGTPTYTSTLCVARDEREGGVNGGGLDGVDGGDGGGRVRGGVDGGEGSSMVGGEGGGEVESGIIKLSVVVISMMEGML
jgi:uncharacterized membrane protein YgcG